MNRKLLNATLYTAAMVAVGVIFLVLSLVLQTVELVTISSAASSSNDGGAKGAGSCCRCNVGCDGWCLPESLCKCTSSAVVVFNFFGCGESLP